MQVIDLHLKNFRCFSEFKLSLKGNLVLIEGPNGAGKSTILEALHYLCYLRSFRTYGPQDLTKIGHESFFVRAHFVQEDTPGFIQEQHIQVGFADKKRLVKVNNGVISSYKELMHIYRVVTLTEDDLALIKGSPDERRSFIDHVVILYEPEFAGLMRSYKAILENRNALFKQHVPPSEESYALWSRELWSLAQRIVEYRKIALVELSASLTRLMENYFQNRWDISLIYKPKKELGNTYEDFMHEHTGLAQEEWRFKRTLFGAHLDDFSISFENRKSKTFASRGQQKLIVSLLKIAQVILMQQKRGSVIFLLDDFMTDFDKERIEQVMPALFDLRVQLIFTCPGQSTYLEQVLQKNNAHIVHLSAPQ